MRTYSAELEVEFADRIRLRRSLLKPSSSPKHICTRNFRSFSLSLASFNRWMSANRAALTSVGSIIIGLLSCSSSNTSVSSVYCISPSRIPTCRYSESLGCSRNCSHISTRFVFSGRNLIVRGRIPRSTGLNKEYCVLLCCFMLCFYVVIICQCHNIAL